MHLASPDWLYHRLTVVGPADARQAFAEAATGAGVIPWVYDYTAFEEDWFHRLMADRRRSAAHAHQLAREFREVVWQAHETAVAAVGVVRTCPLDLHALIPTPWAILRLGPQHPDAIDWHWRHWGTTWALRRVERVVERGETWGCTFYAADWTPWPALATMRARWPALRFDMKVIYYPGRQAREPEEIAHA